MILVEDLLTLAQLENAAILDCFLPVLEAVHHEMHVLLNSVDHNDASRSDIEELLFTPGSPSARGLFDLRLVEIQVTCTCMPCSSIMYCAMEDIVCM